MAKYDSRVGELYLAEYDLTAYTTGMTPSVNRTLHDVTVLGDTGHKFYGSVAGFADKLSWEGLFDDGASGSKTIFDAVRAATAVKVVSVFYGDAAVGNTGFSSGFGWGVGPEIQSRVGNMVTMSAELSLGRMDRVKSLGAKSSNTATGNGTSIDDAAQSSDGGKWSYHVITWAASGGNARWQLILQDSANDSSWSTVGSESVNISAVGAARRTFTGTLERYVRIRHVLDASSGTLEYIAAYERD